MSSRCANSINQLLIIVKQQWVETSIHSRFLRQIVFIEILVNFVIYLERNYCSSQTQSVPTITELKFKLSSVLIWSSPVMMRLCCVFQVQGCDWRLLSAARHRPAAFRRPNWNWRAGIHTFYLLFDTRFLLFFIVWLNQLTCCMFKIKDRDICDIFVGILCAFVAALMSFLAMCCCDSGHQPEWRSEAEDLCGQSSLPEHQHRLPGELSQQKIKYTDGSLSLMSVLEHTEREEFLRLRFFMINCTIQHIVHVDLWDEEASASSSRLSPTCRHVFIFQTSCVVSCCHRRLLLIKQTFHIKSHQWHSFTHSSHFVMSHVRWGRNLLFD